MRITCKTMISRLLQIVSKHKQHYKKPVAILMK